MDALTAGGTANRRPGPAGGAGSGGRATAAPPQSRRREPVSVAERPAAVMPQVRAMPAGVIGRGWDAATPPSADAGVVANRLGYAFYAAALLVALAGATTAATGWLRWPPLPAAGAVAVVELGGVALAVRADDRRRLGEHAGAARVLSAAVAVFAVWFQWWGHPDHRQGLFFAGTSALAYAVWLINSAGRRRDRLRLDRRLPVPAPVYGPVRWLRHPRLTWRARALASADPTLGLFGSLTAATSAIRRERRQQALVRLLRRRISAGRDRLAARIVTTTYDLDEIAHRLAAGADYDRLTALIAADLHPDQTLTPALQPDDRRRDMNHAGQRHGRSTTGRRGTETAARIATIRDRHPDLSTVDIARRVGVTDRTVRRHLAKGPPPP